MPLQSTAPGSLADALRTYFVAFLPLDRVDEALGDVARRAAGAGSDDRIELFRLASGVLHERARLTREVEALVLAMEVRLGVRGAAEVLGMDAAEVEAVLLEVATAETSELPTMGPGGEISTVSDQPPEVVEAPIAPVDPPEGAEAPTGPADPPEAAEAPAPPAPEPVATAQPPSPHPAPPTLARPSMVQVPPAEPEPAGPPPVEPSDVAAAQLDETEALEAVDDPKVVDEPEVADEPEASEERQESEGFEEPEEVREARRGRWIVAVGLGIAVLLAGGLLVFGDAGGRGEPSGRPPIARVEGVVTLVDAVLGPGGQTEPPEKSMSPLPAGEGAALHLRYAEERAELADSISVVWFRGETELYRSSWRLAQPRGSWRAELPAEVTTATGEYRAEVAVNGRVVHTVPFSLTAAAAAASDAPAAPGG